MSHRPDDPEWRLDEYRACIDVIDEQIQALLADRARAAQAIARVKEACGDPVFYRPERERQVLAKVRARHQGPLPEDEVLRIFREIMGACLALEQTLTVAYFGPEGSFTEGALRKHFGGAVAALPQATIGEVFRAVTAKTADFGVVPVENSAEGIVNHTHDLLIRSPLVIVGEVVLRIHHQLLSRAQGLDDIERVAAHPQALAQCRGWIERHLPQCEQVAVSNNAEAARRAADEPHLAAIASREAAAHWGLPILAANIEDAPDNATRFFVIGRHAVGPSGQDKTSLLLTAPHTPGSLHALLEPFARRGISLLRIESRPAQRALWEYVFFVDIAGHEKDPVIEEALAELEQRGGVVRRLGSYPQAL
ncbi:prephenate dehydratase [Acidiferrobacter sp.]|uniref:prephenate dehydratase n=1 Tax=Acidiferrobacter sp. TaxID=1872107 RepID=UPI002621440A|nr:prephenate dehydratase [Acidiferrobacter sp.]